MTNRAMSSLLLACALLLLAPRVTRSEPYPNRPVHVVVPYAAGGPTDIYARVLGHDLSELLKQPFVIDNKPGAATMIGATAVARAPKDGYTLLFTVLTTFTSNPHLYKSMAYTTEDFTPIAQAGTGFLVLVANPSIPAKTIPELLTYLKANPGKVPMGSLGEGTSTSVVGRAFMRAIKMRVPEVPYRGSAEMDTALMAGQVAFAFDGLASVVAQNQAGTLRILAIASSKRSPVLPDVPTLAELGYPDCNGTAYWGLFGPAGLPADVVASLNDATVKAVGMDNFKTRQEADGVVPDTGTPAALSDLIRRDYQSWGRLIEPPTAKPE